MDGDGAHARVVHAALQLGVVVVVRVAAVRVAAGLALAAALQAQGVDALVVDRLAAGANTSRAAVVNARTLEVLEELGVAERLVEQGIAASRFTIRDGQRTLIPVDFSALPTRYPYSLMLPQCTTEQLLLDRLAELGGKVIRPKTLACVAQDADGVTVADALDLIGYRGATPVGSRGATPVGSGLTGWYQTYYRNASTAFCPPATFNVTNGWRILW